MVLQWVERPDCYYKMLAVFMMALQKIQLKSTIFWMSCWASRVVRTPLCWWWMISVAVRFVKKLSRGVLWNWQPGPKGGKDNIFWGVATQRFFVFTPGKWSNLRSKFFRWVGSTTKQFCVLNMGFCMYVSIFGRSWLSLSGAKSDGSPLVFVIFKSGHITNPVTFEIT